MTGGEHIACIQNSLLPKTSPSASLSFLTIALASGIVPMNMPPGPPGQSKADTFAKALLAGASVDHD